MIYAYIHLYTNDGKSLNDIQMKGVSVRKKYKTLEELRESIRKRAREWARKNKDKVNQLQRERYHKNKEIVITSIGA